MIRPKTKLELEIETQKKRGVLVVISGPSAGVGKDTIINELRKRYGFAKIITCTTRPMRPGEKEGIDYHFLLRDKFEKRIKEGFFLEWVKLLDELYGTPKAEALEKINSGKDVLLKVEVRGAKSIKKVMPQAVLIYIAPPSFEILERRMHKRNDDKQSIERKVQVAVWEVEQFEGFDYVVVNEENQIDKTVELVRMIIEAERRKVRGNGFRR